MARADVIEKRVTHTHSTPDGSVLVIVGVPASVVQNDEGPDDVIYDLSVSERLDALISDALTAAPTPGISKVIDWENNVALPVYDLELRFRGPGTSYGSADIRFWNKMTDRLHSAFRIVASEVKNIYGVDAQSPHVVWVGPGSVRVGLQSRVMEPLFDGVHSPGEAGFEVLRIIAEAPTLVDGQAPSSSLLNSEPRLGSAALRALEALTPTTSDPSSSVQILPSPTSFPDLTSAVLTSELLPSIRARQEEFAPSEIAQETIVLEGEIDKVSVDSQFHLREVTAVEGDWGHFTTADVEFSDGYFEAVVGLFRERQRVRVHGYRESTTASRSRKLTLIALEAAITAVIE